MRPWLAKMTNMHDRLQQAGDNENADKVKHADALLFVTYYNHAFSKADREFLLQLGRVKDAFSLDKMFFIINAADLAQSKEELEAVISYMNGELARFGIRFPRLYALSSRLALAEKTGAEPGPRGVLADSGLSAFETDFFRFLTEELAEVAVESAYAELERARRAAEEFARAEKRRMKEEIEAALVEPIDVYLAEQKRAACGDVRRTIQGCRRRTFGRARRSSRQLYGGLACRARRSGGS